MAEEKQRANWGSHVEFILTLIGFAVGLGNVWRFPYLCFRNGGGAFLIPYFICLAVMGIPLFYLELSFGQFASLGPVKIWVINPAMKGLGFAMIIVSALIALYYNVVIAVCVYYFFASMHSELLWTTCNPDWASCYCIDKNMDRNSSNPWNGTRPECDFLSNTTYKPTSPSEEYFNNRVLRLTDSLGETGGMSWELPLCLLLCWTIVFLVLTKGIKSLGKVVYVTAVFPYTYILLTALLIRGMVVYVTAVFPYILLTALLIRGATLDGARDGIDFYLLKPDISRLKDAEVWSDAAVQIFYSLSACSGGLIAMASYNPFNNNILRDTFMVPLINCLTSFYAGFVIFSSLGHMAYTKGVSVADVAAGGPGLAFVAYPEAIAQMPLSPLWAVLFFLMMMMLGFSSEFSIVETVLTGLIDEFPIFNRTRKNRLMFRFCACMTGFLLGLPMCTGAGFHLLDIVDNATGGFPLLFVGLFETIAISFIYGVTRFRKDIEMMICGTPIMRTLSKLSWFYFIPMWVFVTPVCLLAVICFKCYQYKTLHEKTPDIFPASADAIWWLIVLFPLVMTPFYFLGYELYHGGWSLVKKLCAPKPYWGPALKENRTDIYNRDVEMTGKENGIDNTGYENDLPTAPPYTISEKDGLGYGNGNVDVHAANGDRL